MKTKFLFFSIILLSIVSCKKEAKDKSEAFDYIDGVELELNELTNSLLPKTITQSVSLPINPDAIPTSRGDLEGMRTLVKIYDGKENAGIKIPGFGGLTLAKSQSNLNVYYIETKVVNDSVVYGIGYSIHYLFKRMKRGIDISNLSSVAASAQLHSNKTSVSYSLQSFGIIGKDLGKFFKPEVNSNFDVDGFGVIQSKINGIHNVITDSLLSSRTKYTPEKLYFISPKDLRL